MDSMLRLPARAATPFASCDGFATARCFSRRRSLRQPKRHANHPSSSHPPNGSRCAHSAFPSSSAASEDEGKVHRDHSSERKFAGETPRISPSDGGRAWRTYRRESASGVLRRVCMTRRNGVHGLPLGTAARSPVCMTRRNGVHGLPLGTAARSPACMT